MHPFFRLKWVKLLEKNIDKLFDWFSGNFLKANPDKCQLLINTDENVTLKIKNKTITDSSDQNYLVYYSIINLHNIHGRLAEVKCSCKSSVLYELSAT